MISLGWGDPIESDIVLAYRRKGERREHSFSGPVGVLGEDRKSVTWLRREDLPLRDGRLDLSMVPVVGIGGKRKSQPGRAQSFLEENPSFQGALLLYPGTGNWDLGEGMIFVTSREILSGRLVSGGKPEEAFVNERWLRDGRWVADRATVLHGKTLKVLAEGIEREPGPARIAEAFRYFSKPFECVLAGLHETASREAAVLERRRCVLSGEQERDMFTLATAALARKLEQAGVRFVRDIPVGFNFITADIEPELVAQAETLGTIEIPGLGRRLVSGKADVFMHGHRPVIEIPVEDLKQVTDWPFTDVALRVPELNDVWIGCREWEFSSGDLALMWDEGVDRWPRILAALAEKWLEVQRDKNRPRNSQVTDPREADPSTTPAPVMWGTDLLTGEEHTAYAALIHRVEGCKGSIYDRGWEIRWYDDAAKATEVDAEARREARSHVEARRLEAELAAAAAAVELPVAVPAAFVVPQPEVADVMRRLGFAPEQFRIESEGPVQVCVKQAEYYWSKYSGEARLLSSAVFASHWWQKDGETVVVFANATPRDLLGQDDNLAAAGQLGVAKDKILAVRQQFAAEHDAAEQAYRASLAAFVRALQAEPAYASLSSDMQAKLAKLGDAYGTPAVDAEELRREWGKAVVLHAREQRGEGLANFGGHFRRMGATGNVDFWVVRADGSLRDPDEVQYRKRYTSEGEKYWRMVGPQELALTWSKAYTAAPHEFSVANLSVGGCTPEQLATAHRIEREIAECFSMPVHGGWGLGAEPVRVIDLGCAMPSEPPSASVSAPVSLADLRAKFGKKR